MIDANVYLRRTPLNELEEARPRGIQVLDSWDQVTAVAEKLLLSDALTLFARPSVTRSNGANTGEVIWYGIVAGVLTPFGKLPPDQRDVLAAGLSLSLERLRPLMTDPTVGPLFSAWLNLPSLESDVFLVENRPVITNWGLLPANVAKSPEARSRLFHQGLGRFLRPGTPVPPFEADVAPSPAGAPEPPVTEPQAAAQPLTQNENAAAPPTFSGAPDIVVPRSIEVTNARAWLPVAIATGIAAIILLLLWIPGVLVYPVAGTGQRAPIDPRLLAQTRETLERRARELETSLRQAVCVPGPAGLPGARQPAPSAPNAREPEPGRPADGTPSGASPGTPLRPDTPSSPADNSKERSDTHGPQERLPTPSVLPPSAASLAGPQAAGEQPSNLVAHLDKVTALVIAPSAQGGGASIGTGFFINDRHLVTNRHVIEGADTARVFIVNRAQRRPVAGRVVESSRSSEIGGGDFAIIEVASAQGRPAMTLTPRVARGDTVIAAGYPSLVMSNDTGFQRLLEGDSTNIPDAAITQGMVTALQTSERGFPVMVHGATISQGNSGGPLSDLCGRSVGVNTYGHVDASNALRLNFALRTEGLKRFLDEHRIAYTINNDACVPTQAASAAPASQPAPGTPPMHATPPSETGVRSGQTKQ
jgi:S1-C subfamily serine protease